VRWDVVATDEFAQWYDTLEDDQADALDARVELLRDFGPSLGTPTVDRVEGSSIHNLEELRVSKRGELRVLFVFDPERRAVLLVGGDKSGRWTEWYASAIPRAERLYADYLKESK
jgi:hypothetical protein